MTELIVAWFAANSATCGLALYAVLNVVNAALPYAAMRDGPKWQRALGWLMDRAAVLARKDSPETLTVPGRASQMPTVDSFLAAVAASEAASEAARRAPTPAVRAGDDRETPDLHPPTKGTP